MFSGRIPRATFSKPTPRHKSRGRVYCWKCVEDPSDGKPFRGNLFRLADIEAGGFETGTTFRNVHTGEVKRL